MRHNTFTPDNLNNAMEFGRVIRVHPDGTVSDDYVTANPARTGDNIPAPFPLYAPDMEDGAIQSDFWTLALNRSGQEGYDGPSFHESEYIGGRLAADILANPGVYVAVVDYSTADCHAEYGCDNYRDSEDGPCDVHNIAGWGIAYRLDDGSVF